MTLPSGSRSPALFQTLSLVADPIAFFDRNSAKYGDTFTARVLGPASPPVVFLGNPEAIQAVFTTLADAFEFGKVTNVFRPLVGNESLIMNEGPRHLRQRQLLMPALHREQLHSQGHLIVDLTKKQTIDWKASDAIAVRQEMSEISLQVILQVVFGLVPGERYERLKQQLSKLLEAITSELYSIQFFFSPLQQNLGSWSPWGQFLQQMAQIDSLIYAEIADRRSHSLDASRTDILSVLMMARDDMGESIGDRELRDQLMTLLLLGHETTGSALTWAFYWLHQMPECLAKLRQELDELGENPDPIALSQSPYLTAVCKEALRVYPIALISQPRKVKRTIELEGYTYQPGTILIPCVYLAHRRPETYENPTQFNPDRFLDRKFSASEFLPFGGGSRSCIGMALSMFEMKLVLATVLTNREFVSNLDRAIRPTRRGITFVPPDRFRLSVVGDRSSNIKYPETTTIK